MAEIQPHSTSNPLDNRVLAVAIEFILKADSMGVLTSEVDTLNLDIEAIIRAAKDVTELGIGRRVVINPERWREYSADDLCSKLKTLSAILEESPQPMSEWKRLRMLLSDEMLATMTHVSEQSVRRYATESRLRDGAGVAVIGFARHRVEHVAENLDGRLRRERVHDDFRSVRHDMHVGFVNGLPARNGRSVDHQAGFQGIVVQHIHMERGMVQGAAHIREPAIDVI